MKKETVKMFNLEAAFKALDELEIPAVTGGRTIANRINLHERLHAKDAHEVLIEDYFDVNDVDELEAAKEEREAEVAKAKLARIEKIVDLDAETEDDILPSYEGKIIMQCPQCMTLFYKNEEDIEKSEETPDVVNVNEICQHCGNSSGYTLVGKVGKIDETEAENFELEDLPVEENDSEADLDNEGTEEDTENLDLDTLDETSEAEDLDLDLDLDLAEEGEEETNESIHKSSLLKTIEKENDLKSEQDSEHLTLNEEVDKTQETKQPEEHVEESIHNSEALKDAEEASDLKSNIESENLTLLESDSEVEEATDKLFDKLWSAPQPTEEETLATLAELGEGVDSVEHTELEEREFTEAEDFDEESFDKCLTEYLQNVYSNVNCFEATACSFTNNKLLVEGLVKFNSGKEKSTKFVFEGKKCSCLIGTNPDFYSKAAFKLSTSIKNKTIYTESLGYSYKINESLIKGVAKK